MRTSRRKASFGDLANGGVGGGLPVRACSIVQEIDSDGHAVDYRRDATGRLLRIEAGEGWIALDYDERGRISRASDNAKRWARYEYDEPGVWLASHRATA